MTSKESIINSFIWVSVERISTIGLLFIGTIVLAHFLSPSAFGLVGILTIFTAISMMLIDSGMGGSLIKEKMYLRVTILHYLYIMLELALLSI